MQNVKTRIENNLLVIEIDLTERQGLSKSEKNDIIASTGGNIDVGDGIKLGLNCYVKAGTPVPKGKSAKK
jgi:hypothetical protein